MCVNTGSFDRSLYRLQYTSRRSRAETPTGLLVFLRVPTSRRRVWANVPLCYIRPRVLHEGVDHRRDGEAGPGLGASKSKKRRAYGYTTYDRPICRPASRTCTGGLSSCLNLAGAHSDRLHDPSFWTQQYLGNVYIPSLPFRAHPAHGLGGHGEFPHYTRTALTRGTLGLFSLRLRVKNRVQ